MPQALTTKILIGLVVTAGLSVAFLGGKVSTLSKQQELRLTEQQGTINEPADYPQYAEPQLPAEPALPTPEVMQPEIDWDEITRKQAESDRKFYEEMDKRQEEAEKQQEEYQKELKEYTDKLKKEAEQREKERDAYNEKVRKSNLDSCISDAKSTYSYKMAQLANNNAADSSAAQAVQVNYQNSVASCNSQYGE